MSVDVTIVPTGLANIASVVAAFRRLDVEPRFANDSDDIARADAVVMPGVGAFGAAMGRIDEVGWREPLAGRISAGRPTLAVCLGLQLLFEKSEESPGVHGLGAVPGAVTRLPGEVTVPQLGWNRVTPDERSRFVEPGWAYFANSYRVESVPDDWIGTTADYGGTLVSTVERGGVLACQFHPELSGEWGSALLQRWLDAAGRDS
ncbi:MAG: imidazole glycerol phosphate synthase subunit HisH [Actinomycetota bacterium]